MSQLLEVEPRNRLLDTATPNEMPASIRKARVIRHEQGYELWRRGDRIEEIVFPLDGLVSITIDTTEGDTVEVAIIGAEGMAGFERILGSEWADWNAVVQVAGTMAHIQVPDVLKAASSAGAFRASLDRFLRTVLVEVAQTAVCNTLHSVEQRTARWLLQASELAATPDLRLTHEFMSHMLATRRSTVTTVLGVFTRAGLVTTQRGQISIADREGLRSVSCECYEIIRQQASAQ
jgi:CRP-like cAMP-binding protein